MRTLYKISAFAFLLSIFSCHSDDDVSPDTVCLYSGFESEVLNMEVLYDDQDRVTGVRTQTKSEDVNYTINSEVIYEGDRINKIVSDENNYSTYEYGADDLISVERVYNKESSSNEFNLTTETYFFYNDDKLLVKDSISNGYSYQRLHRYEYDDNGNLLKIYTSTSQYLNRLESEYLEYDDKTSPFSQFNFRVFYFLDTRDSRRILTLYQPAKSTNNPMLVRTYSSQGSSDTHYTYSYDETGLVSSFSYSIGQYNYSTIINYTCD